MKCTRFETRLFADLCNGCTRPPFDQELVSTADTEWTISYVDGTNLRSTDRTYFAGTGLVSMNKVSGTSSAAVSAPPAKLTPVCNEMSENGRRREDA